MYELIYIIIGIIIGIVFTYYFSKKILLPFVWKKTIIANTLDASRSVLKGKISEQIAPLLKEFKYNLADARFLGSPIDYIIFDGMSDGKDVFNLVFMDVKKGKANLTRNQNKIREAIDLGRLKWETLRLE